jgi:integrase
MLREDFEQNGADVIRRVRERKPEVYLASIVSLLPRQKEKIESPFIDISDEELQQLEEHLREVRAKTIKRLELVAGTGGTTLLPRRSKYQGDETDIISSVDLAGRSDIVAKSQVAAATPTTQNSSVRKYLTPREVERLMVAARKSGRYGHRDATMILIAFRHGLRASELCDLTWNMIELDSGRIHVRRAKNGVDSTHPLTGKEIRALRQLRRENLQGRYVFNTERGGPVTRAWFLKMVRRTGELAKLSFPVHPHMLRHACGFKLANDGVDTRALQQFLGHRNIMHTVRYTELRSDRFDGFWKD